MKMRFYVGEADGKEYPRVLAAARHYGISTRGSKREVRERVLGEISAMPGKHKEGWQIWVGFNFVFEYEGQRYGCHTAMPYIEELARIALFDINGKPTGAIVIVTQWDTVTLTPMRLKVIHTGIRPWDINAEPVPDWYVHVPRPLPLIGRVHFIQFMWEGLPYRVGMEAHDEGLPIELPDGTILTCDNWHSTMPPMPINLRKTTVVSTETALAEQG